MDLIEVSPDQLLFKGQLYHKQNSKLKKLKVHLMQSFTSDGDKVYNLDIRGIKHKYHFQLDFSSRELCFLRFEEVQDNVQEVSCLSCLDRNFYPPTVYSRLLILLYSYPDNGDEARCIKIPFIQRGNIHGSNTLRKLSDVIYNSVASAEELKHWSVCVERCGDLQEGERVFLCLTQTALIVVLDYHILHYHAYTSSEISVDCFPGNSRIEFTVHDRTWVSDTNNTDNFALFKTYSFRTTDYQSIEKTFQNLKRKSLLSPYGPSAHFNILHSEMSMSAMPGTTSDNVMIIPHRLYWHDNNNSGSTSGSNGHLPSGKIDNVVMFHGPTPHLLKSEIDPHKTASSNGSIPNNALSDSFLTSVDSDNIERMKSEDLSLRPRGGQRDITVADVQRAIPPSHLKLADEDQTLRKEANPSSPTQHTPRAVSDSAPGLDAISTFHRVPNKKLNTSGNFEDFTIGDLGIDNLCYYPDHEDTIPKFATVDEADLLPPPRPCTSFSQTFGDLQYITPARTPPFDSGISEDQDVPLRKPIRGLLRSRSSMNLNEDIFLHSYINITQDLSSRGSIHDDSMFFRFYYNTGLLRVTSARMSKKLQRRNRLSKGIADIDFNKLEDHEQWYDRDFKVRNKDLKFCNLHNIPAEKSKAEYDYTTLEREDDPYWTNNDLCFTIQRILEEGPKKHELSQEVQSALDLTAEQLMQMQVLLSLMPAENDWRNLAEYIGLASSDITIVEHFCYTYRVLAADVVLTHWMLRDQHQSDERISCPPTPPCHWDSLVQFLESHDRDDVTYILRSTRENEHVNESTHF